MTKQFRTETEAREWFERTGETAAVYNKDGEWIMTVGRAPAAPAEPFGSEAALRAPGYVR